MKAICVIAGIVGLISSLFIDNETGRWGLILQATVLCSTGMVLQEIERRDNDRT